MADNRLYVSTKPTTLTASITSTALSVTVALLEDREDNTLTMADFGTLGFGVFEPGSSNEEHFLFSAISGTTLTITRGVAMQSPYTASGTGKSHAAGTKIVIYSNTPAAWNSFANKENDETIIQQWTFPNGANRPQLAADTDTAVDAELTTFGQLSRVAVAGAADASETVRGIIELSTTAEAAAGTSTGSTGARLVPPGDMFNNTSSAATLVPVTDADGDIPVEFMELDAAWNFTSTLDISTASNWSLASTAFTGTMALLNESSTFFGATDITGAEAETLTDGSDASALHVHGDASSKLFQSTTDITVANTTTSTPIMSFTLPANSLSTDNIVRMKLNCSAFARTSGNFNIQLNYGSTLIATGTITNFIAVQDRVIINVELYADGATGAQEGMVHVDLIDDDSPNTSVTTSQNAVEFGTASEDSTGALTVTVDVAWSIANAGNTVTFANGFAELIR